MLILILEMLLALAIIIGIMVWTLSTRRDAPGREDAEDSKRDGR